MSTYPDFKESDIQFAAKVIKSRQADESMDREWWGAWKYGQQEHDLHMSDTELWLQKALGELGQKIQDALCREIWNAADNH